jgi:modification methylase
MDEHNLFLQPSPQSDQTPPSYVDGQSVSSPIQLFRGDHLRVLPALPHGCVNLICTSPNYNLGKVYGGDVDGDRLPLWAYKQNLIDQLLGCQHVLRVGGVLAMVLPPAIHVESTDGQRLFFTADFVRATLHQQGWLIRESIIVGKSASDDRPMPFARGGIKGNFDDTRMRFSHEVIVLASKGAYRIGARETWVDKPELREWLKDVWWMRPVRAAGPYDPQPFSTEMVRRLVWIFTSAGDLVLDPNAGTGVTGRVAWELGRRAWLVEREPSYWDRLEDLVRAAARSPYISG